MKLNIIDRNENRDPEFVKAVYSGGDIHMDAYKGVVDTGAPQTVAGKAWMEAFTEDVPWMENKRYRENKFFRFGNGPVYTLNKNGLHHSCNDCEPKNRVKNFCCGRKCSFTSWFRLSARIWCCNQHRKKGFV